MRGIVRVLTHWQSPAQSTPPLAVEGLKSWSRICDAITKARSLLLILLYLPS